MNFNDTIDQLPPEYTDGLLANIREVFLQTGKTLVVLDDDPTGTQTCYDTTVLTSWDTALIAHELLKKPSVLFILTNSRSLAEAEAVQRTLVVSHNLLAASQDSGRQIEVISRSDSTLRGHFPAEVDAIAEAMGRQDAVRLLVPAFIEGMRYTLGDIHYVVEQENLVPVSDTPFARDVSFGYTHSDLKLWVEEKTKGRIKAVAVMSVSLETIRVGGPHAVAEILKACRPGSTCIVNIVSHRDLEVLVMGILLAEGSGSSFLYRTSATFVPLRAGLPSGKTFLPHHADSPAPRGSLVIVGSHVAKTTRQLEALLKTGSPERMEINATTVLSASDRSLLAETIIQKTDQCILAGKSVVIYTSRELLVGTDSESSLKISARISDFLVHIMTGLTVRPSLIIAKGGITSSDLASRGLAAKSATILGSVIPGVPVWKLDPASKFPGLQYVVFPGNVGDDDALLTVFRKFNG